MPEYLAPGVFVEEVSYRSKSIEGVSTTTTGFVGPTRYGPVEIEPEVITNVTEFERVYGKGEQLNFSDTGQLHNYLWHGVRSFFEEGGKRLYVARTFLPVVSTGENGYKTPPDQLKDDHAIPANGLYVTDGHARCWLTPQTAAMSNVLRAIDGLGGALRVANGLMGAVIEEKDASLPLQLGAIPDTAADAKVAKTAKELESALDDSCSVQLDAVEAAIITLKKVYAAPSTSDLKSKLDNVIPLAKKTATATFIQVDEIAALTATSGSSKTTATDAFDLLADLKSAADQVVTDEGVNTTDIAKLADAISKSCEDLAAGVIEGDAHMNLSAAKTAAEQVVTDVVAAAVPPAGATEIDTAKKSAVGLVAKSEKAASACNALVELALHILNQAYVVGKKDDQASGKFPLQHIVDLVDMVKGLASKAADALKDAQRGAYLRAWFVEQAAEAVKTLVVEFDKLTVSGTSTSAALAGHVPHSTPDERKGAVLLRARFPGAAGNISIRFNLKLGQNGLVPDSQNAARSSVSGLTPGDVVWIGTKSNATGKLYLAYPKQDGSDWYFATDNKPTNSKFWLNQPPDSSSTKLQSDLHEVRTVTAAVDVIWQNGSAQTWGGLALQPDHRRAGSADSIMAKFTVTPASGTDARSLPFSILVDEGVSFAGGVYKAIFARSQDDDIKLGAWPLSVTYQLTGGNDGQRPGAAEYTGSGEGPDAPKTGLKAFEDVEDISIVAAPGAMFGYMNNYTSDAQQIVSSLISHAENMKYRIAVLESGDGQSIADVRAMRARYDSKHAALYYPWVRVLDPITRDEIHLPPSGFVAGIYARNDIDRAVYKAPANEVVRGAIGFQTLLNKAQQEVLNPEGINCFRFFEGRGFRLWGARTISSDPEWKYVNVRRYFAYLERSIDRGTQWAVFEPNGEALWANVRETISDFLYNEWKNGALLGSDPKSAYFVRCDRSTMTQNDLDNGRLICKIGVAALKPAEFVIFQIGQWTSDRKA